MNHESFVKEVVEFYKANPTFTREKVAEKFGISASSVFNYAKKYGALRPRGGGGYAYLRNAPAAAAAEPQPQPQPASERVPERVPYQPVSTVAQPSAPTAQPRNKKIIFRKKAAPVVAPDAAMEKKKEKLKSLLWCLLELLDEE